MGTRGTLRVYVDGELKIRQYNQWDSYPTGQFAMLCDFLSDEKNVMALYGVLKHTKFFTKDEVDQITKNEWWKRDQPGVSPYYAADFYFLTNRDWGAKILPMLCMMPTRFYQDNMPDGTSCRVKIADWADVFDETDLDPEEGNYIVTMRRQTDGDIDVTISGEWHDVSRSYGCIPENYMEEANEWEDQAKEE